jgi:hypothetical protein
MAQKKIKCAVYKSEEAWGGGHYFLPAKNHEGIRMTLREECFKIAKKPIGIFEFEESFLNIVLKRNVEDNFIYWDNIWCE